MSDNRHRVCPVERAGKLDRWFRRWLQNPQRILSPYVSAGMTVLDIGCGPGFFAVELARMVGPEGRVIATDLQAGMLDLLRGKIRGTALEPRVTLRQTPADRLGLTEPVDFALAFYVVHEVPDAAAFFRELAALLRPGGQALIVEPTSRVFKAEFAETLRLARAAGFELRPPPWIAFSRTGLLQKPAG